MAVLKVIYMNVMSLDVTCSTDTSAELFQFTRLALSLLLRNHLCSSWQNHSSEVQTNVCIAANRVGNDLIYSDFVPSSVTYSSPLMVNVQLRALNIN